MPDKNLAGIWIRRFLMEHLIAERNLGRNTQTSYRDCLALLLPFIEKTARKPVDRLSIDDLSPDRVRNFLTHLETGRRCSISTRNQRLAAIHSLAYFVGAHCPEHVAWCAQIRQIPFKKTARGTLPYLEKPEMDALLGVPDRRTPQGMRDYALMLFLYNSGARANEAAQITIGDLDLVHPPMAVKILGKGGKVRLCPLWAATASVLTPLVAGRNPSEKVFLNRRGQPTTRFGVHALVRRCVAKAGGLDSLRAKRISPHTIRHTTAVHLLRAGVDINTIRAWLGHVHVDTTNIYAEVDMEMKAKALAHCEIRQTTAGVMNGKGRMMMDFLKGL
jgi:site-specific recombinase XerD